MTTLMAREWSARRLVLRASARGPGVVVGGDRFLPARTRLDSRAAVQQRGERLMGGGGLPSQNSRGHARQPAGSPRIVVAEVKRCALNRSRRPSRRPSRA
jgi:hypothetical protein